MASAGKSTRNMRGGVRCVAGGRVDGYHKAVPCNFDTHLAKFEMLTLLQIGRNRRREFAILFLARYAEDRIRHFLCCSLQRGGALAA